MTTGLTGSNGIERKEPVMKTRWLWTSSALLVVLITCTATAAEKAEDRMKAVSLKTEIAEGKDKQVDVLFEGPRRKIVQITLRHNAILDAHKAAEPITIQCIAGTGTLTVGEERKPLELVPGVLVTIEPDTIHEIRSQPSVSILLSKFAEK